MIEYRSVLIIDDDKTTRNMLRQMLNNLDFLKTMYVIEAQSWSEASAKIENQQFQLIIVDFNLLPNQNNKKDTRNGLSLLKKHHEELVNNKTKVLLISGSLDQSIIQNTIKLGYKHILAKPLTPEQIEKKIRVMVTTKGNI
jgi:two-component system, response regulator YesN